MYAILDLINEMERVDFSVVPVTCGISFRLQKILYRAQVEMELRFAELLLSNPALIKDAEDYLEILEQRDRYRTILDRIDRAQFCPEPVGGVKMSEHTLQNDKKYYSIRSLWDLSHIFNLGDTEENLRWKEVYYLPEESLSNHWNRSYFDYNERGREFFMKEDVYYVEDIERWVVVESCYDSLS